MSDLKKEDRIAKAFHDYPELNEFVNFLLDKAEHREPWTVVIGNAIGWRHRYPMEDILGSRYEVNMGQKEGSKWHVYKLTRLFDGEVFEIGKVTEHGKILFMTQYSLELDGRIISWLKITTDRAELDFTYFRPKPKSQCLASTRKTTASAWTSMKSWLTSFMGIRN